MITFGDIFTYGEKEYVFFAKTDELTYAAEIFDIERTKEVLASYNRMVKKNGSGYCESRPLYCFVILQTENFKNRMAHLGMTDHGADNISFDTVGCKLNDQDLNELKNIIKDPSSAVNRGLRELVKDI